MNVNATAIQAFGEGVATTALNVARVFTGPVTHLASAYQEDAPGGTVEHYILPSTQKIPIDLGREMTNLIITESSHEANAKMIQTQDELSENNIGLIVNDRV